MDNKKSLNIRCEIFNRERWVLKNKGNLNCVWGFMKVNVGEGVLVWEEDIY